MRQKPGFPGGFCCRALVKLVSSLTWLPSSKGQTSTLFHLWSWWSQRDFCSGLEWGFSTMHIHKAPTDTCHQRYQVRLTKKNRMNNEVSDVKRFNRIPIKAVVLLSWIQRFYWTPSSVGDLWLPRNHVNQWRCIFQRKYVEFSDKFKIEVSWDH